jgi:hypothetical protein
MPRAARWPGAPANRQKRHRNKTIGVAMETQPPTGQSMIKAFNRDYLLISIIPLVVFFLFATISAVSAQRYIANLIKSSITDIYSDAKFQLEELGKAAIRDKAVSTANLVSLYIENHPDLTIEDLQREPKFSAIALQTVGQTGYTCLYEAGSAVMRFHPNPKLIDRDMAFLSEQLPSWWSIFKPSISGKETSGYYDWIEPDSSRRKKYMTMLPVRQRLQGKNPDGRRDHLY